MERSFRFVSIGVATLAMLAGCDQATVERGIEVEIDAVSTTPAQRCADGVSTGSEGQSFCTAAGERVDLINGLAAPFPVRALTCPSALALLSKALGAIIPAAMAHGGHITAPPGAIDVAEPAGTAWTLGELPLAPGRYCGVELSLEQLPASTFTAAVPPPHDDILLYTRPCHFPNPAPEPPASSHRCYTVPVRGAPASVELAFPEPIALDTQTRSLHVEVAIDFATWFDGIDFATLETDPLQQQALLQNVIDSLRIARAATGAAP